MNHEHTAPVTESRRTRGLPVREVLGGSARVAATRGSRLRGLAGIPRDAAPVLLIPRCRSIHTFGMRFALDVVFLDVELREISRRSGVRPRRIAFERRARAVLEIPAGAQRL